MGKTAVIKGQMVMKNGFFFFIYPLINKLLVPQVKLLNLTSEVILLVDNICLVTKKTLFISWYFNLYWYQWQLLKGFATSFAQGQCGHSCSLTRLYTVGCLAEDIHTDVLETDFNG